MFMTEKDFKHRLLLMIVLAYASGLRIGEVVCFKCQDIDIARKSVIIKSGKERKDRYTVILETVIKTLTDYHLRYNIDDWLFAGAAPNKYLVIRSAQHIFEHTLKAAKIEKLLQFTVCGTLSLPTYFKAAQTSAIFRNF